MPVVIANGVRTYFEIAGEGEALLLVAGNGMDHTAFRDQIATFARHFRCITYDLRGIGKSDVPESGYTVPDMARDALGLLAALQIPAAHVAGYSLGGAIGQQMAIDAPDRVSSLSLYSAFSHVEPYLRRRYELLVKILAETTPELWAMFTTFSAFGEEYINAHDDDVEKEVAAAHRALARRRRSIEGRSGRTLQGHPRARCPVAPVRDSVSDLDRRGELRPGDAAVVRTLPARTNCRIASLHLRRRAASPAQFHAGFHRGRAGFPARGASRGVARQAMSTPRLPVYIRRRIDGALPR